MKVGKAIYTILLGAVPVTDIVGIGDAAKIFPEIISQGTESPAIKYKVISVVPTNTKDGVSKLDVFRLQIDCFSTKYLEADDLSCKVRDALDRYHGTVSGVQIDKIIFDSVQDLYDEQSNEYQKSSDYIIRVKN